MIQVMADVRLKLARPNRIGESRSFSSAFMRDPVEIAAKLAQKLFRLHATRDSG